MKVLLIIFRNKADKVCLGFKSLRYRKINVFLIETQKGLLIPKCTLSKTDWQDVTDKSVFRQALIF